MTDQQKEELTRAMMDVPTRFERLPTELWVALYHYRKDHTETGGFLRSVLENDLAGAVRRADRENLPKLGLVVEFLIDQFPEKAWGSPEKVRAWLDHKEERHAK
jgi:hypothetical protein